MEIHISGDDIWDVWVEVCEYKDCHIILSRNYWEAVDLYQKHGLGSKYKDTRSVIKSFNTSQRIKFYHKLKDILNKMKIKYAEYREDERRSDAIRTCA